MRAARVAALVAVAGCGGRTVTDARWTFSWRAEGAPLTDTWTDGDHTCDESRADAENLRSLRQKSALFACARRCRDAVPCELRCAQAITEAGARCVEVTRRVPRPFWIMLH